MPEPSTWEARLASSGLLTVEDGPCYKACRESDSVSMGLDRHELLLAGPTSKDSSGDHDRDLLAGGPSGLEG